MAAAGRERIRLFTGLLVRPEPGHVLHLSGGANRRNRLVDVREQLIGDDGALVPLVLELEIASQARAPFRLLGEVATLAPLRPAIAARTIAIEDAPELAEAHARFYDASYFETKKGEITGKYRRQVAARAPRAAAPEGRLEVAEAGSRLELEPMERFTTAAGPEPVRRRGSGLARAVFRNLVDLEVMFDGQTLTVEPDAARLAALARTLRRRWERALPEELRRHPGAFLYLAKYVTPHVPGEPHFFVKPWALLRTSPGWSCLLEGVHGAGYDVLRGVVHTDLFHAVPAVFALHRLGEPVRVPRETPLLRILPVPRDLLDAAYATVTPGDLPG